MGEREPTYSDAEAQRAVMAAIARQTLADAQAIADHARSILDRLAETRDPAREACPYCADWHTTEDCPR